MRKNEGLFGSTNSKALKKIKLYYWANYIYIYSTLALANQHGKTSELVELKFKRRKVVFTFTKKCNQWILTHVKMFKKKLGKWILIAVFMVSTLLPISNNQKNFLPHGYSFAAKQSITTVVIGRGGSDQPENDQSMDKEKRTADSLSTSEVSKNATKTDEERAMEALVQSAIQKAENKKWPKSIAKFFKQGYKLLVRILDNELVQIIVRVEALAANAPQPHMTRPKSKIQLRIAPGERRPFPPGTISSCAKSTIRQPARTSLAAHPIKRSSLDLERTSDRRQQPFIDVAITGLPNKRARFSLVQLGNKGKHFPVLLKTLGLPSNYLDKFETKIAQLNEVGQLLKTICESKAVLVKLNGTLNYREPAVHVFDPDHRLYIGFEPQPNSDDLYYITHYSLTLSKSRELADNIKNDNWDGNVGLPVEELEQQLKNVGKNVRENRRKQQTSEYYNEFFPTVAPEHKLSNKQIQSVEKLVRKYKRGEILTSQEIKILTRFRFLNEGWQFYLDRANIDIDNPIRNLWHDNNVDPSVAPSIYEQIDKIVGPTLGDID